MSAEHTITLTAFNGNIDMDGTLSAYGLNLTASGKLFDDTASALVSQDGGITINALQNAVGLPNAPVWLNLYGGNLTVNGLTHIKHSEPYYFAGFGFNYDADPILSPVQNTPELSLSSLADSTQTRNYIYPIYIQNMGLETAQGSQLKTYATPNPLQTQYQEDSDGAPSLIIGPILFDNADLLKRFNKSNAAKPAPSNIRLSEK